MATGNFYILDSQAEFDACQQACFAAHMAAHCDCPEYDQMTDCWAASEQRLTDNKWICRECPDYDNAAGYTVEVSDPGWFPADDAE